MQLIIIDKPYRGRLELPSMAYNVAYRHYLIIAITCADPPTIPGSTVESMTLNFSNPYLYKHNITYTCREGYHWNNENEFILTCGEDGHWSDEKCTGMVSQKKII